MNLERIWLLTIEALDAMNTPVVLRFSSGDYTDPSGNYYDLRIKQPALFTSGAYTGSVIQSGSRTAFGETVLINADGGLDYLADYAVDGRVSVLSIIGEDGTITPIIQGTVRGLAFQEKLISVLLRDPQEVLEQDHPHNTYLGNNILPDGLEGTENDLKGRVKPKIYGKVRSATPSLVNTSELIYEVHDTTISPMIDVTIVDVYDRGVMLTKHTHYTTLAAFLAASVPSGHYATYEGYFKLGSTPTGTITCDVDSVKHLLGDVFELLAIEAGYTLNATDKTTLNTYGSVQFFMKEITKTSRVFDLFATSVGGYWYFEGNVIRAKQLVSPTSTSSLIEDYQIISISRNSTGAGENGIPVYSVKLKADKIETVQNDLAGAVDDTYRARVSVEYREALFTNSSVKIRHPLSKEMELTTALFSLTDAQTQAQRIQQLLGVRRDSVNLNIRLDESTINEIAIGKQLTLNSYKFGYSVPRNFIVLGYTLNAKLFRVELSLWG